MEELRILEVVDNYFPIIDGVVNVVDNYCRILNGKDGVTCDALVPWYPKTFDGGGYNVIRCLSMSGGKYGVRLPLPMLDLRLKKYLKENHYDIIHCHSPVTLSRTMLRYARRNNIPVVFTVHTKYHEEINRSVKLKCLQKFALNFLLYSIMRMDYVWAVSNGSKECLQQIYKVDAPCEVVKNGTEKIVVEPEKLDLLVKRLKEKYAISDEVVFSFVGRVVVVKNISMLLETMKLLKEKGLKFKFLIVGDGDYRKKLEKQAKELGVDDVVVFVGQVADRELLAAYYKMADYFLFSSTFDTFSLSAKEAAMMGTPSLLVKDSSSAEGIVDGENGFLAELSPEAWANKIFEVQNNPSVYNKVVSNLDSVYTTWEQMMDVVLEKYKEIVKEGKPKEKA